MYKNEGLRFAVLGCGNIGSRLLQSIGKMGDSSLRGIVYCIDPSPSALKLSEERFEQSRTNKIRLIPIGSINELPSELDLAIISTSSKYRLSALEELLVASKPKNILLEKVLFSRLSDYENAINLVKNVGAKCWVNCSRNVWPCYQKLKSLIAEAGAIKSFKVQGNSWNLASNIIHFISLYEYLSSDRLINGSLNDKYTVYESKRQGYWDVHGSVSLSSAAGVDVYIESQDKSVLKKSVQVETESGVFTLDEVNWLIHSSNFDQPLHANMLHTSQLEKPLYKIVQKRESRLPNLMESSRQHRLLFDIFESCFSSIPNSADLPIT